MGNPLALDSFVYEIAAAPKEIDAKNRAAVAAAVAPMVGWREADLLQALEQHKTTPHLLLHAGVGPDVGEEILSWGVYTITATPKPARITRKGGCSHTVWGLSTGNGRAFMGWKAGSMIFCARIEQDAGVGIKTYTNRRGRQPAGVIPLLPSSVRRV